MIVTRRSNITGVVHSADLPVTKDQMMRFERGDGYIQDIFKHLPPEQREFILTGVTPQEWAETSARPEE